MNPVNWFEIAVLDFEKAKSFYETILNVELTVNDMNNAQMGMFPWDSEESGSSGAIIKAEGCVPSDKGSVVYFHVDDIDGTLKRINANGGKTIIPKTSIGEHGFFAQFNDTEGNRLALHSE